MIRFERCKHISSAPIVVLEILPDSQAGTGRHKCTICAYQLGYNDGKTGNFRKPLENCTHGKSAPVDILTKLPLSQAGTGRHKCAICAYVEGLMDGFEETARKDDFSEKDIAKIVDIPNIAFEKTDPPSFHRTNIALNRPFKSSRKVDYVEVEKRKQAIGLAGEHLVIEYESRFLIEQGRRDLAKNIVHTSEEEGDNAGYDIKSYTLKGEKKFIEVKTTSREKSSPFIISNNELDFAKRNSDFYYIYRIFDFSMNKKSCSFYVVPGDPERAFTLIPTEYKAFRI